LYAGTGDRAEGDREGKALEQREVDMNIEPLCLEGSKAASDGLEAVADRVEMIQSLLEAEIGKVVGDQLVAEEGRELFVLLQEGVFEVSAEDMMAVLDTIDDGGEFALHSAVYARAEDLGDLIGRQPPQAHSQLRSNSLWIGKLRLKMKLRQYSIWEIA